MVNGDSCFLFFGYCTIRFYPGLFQSIMNVPQPLFMFGGFYTKFLYSMCLEGQNDL